MSAVSTGIMRSTEERYRTLPDASSALADQPTIQAVLHSLRDVLSTTWRLHGADLYFWTVTNRVCACSTSIETRTHLQSRPEPELSRIGAAARVIEEQKPVFIPDTSQEMLRHPELAPFAAEVVGRTSYLFPVSAAQKRYGFLAATKLQGEEFAPEDVEMLRSLALHVALALECALARDKAELYQQQVVKVADSTQAVAGDQQSHRFQTGHERIVPFGIGIHPELFLQRFHRILVNR